MKLLVHKITTLWPILVLFACQSSSFKVPEATMVEIMSDALTLEAGNSIKYNYAVLPDSLWNTEYAFILKKHNVSPADFEATMESYKHNGEKFGQLIEKVIDNLQKSEMRRKNPKA